MMYTSKNIVFKSKNFTYCFQYPATLDYMEGEWGCLIVIEYIMLKANIDENIVYAEIRKLKEKYHHHMTIFDIDEVKDFKPRKIYYFFDIKTMYPFVRNKRKKRPYLFSENGQYNEPSFWEIL